jgi:hypothetical protein
MLLDGRGLRRRKLHRLALRICSVSERPDPEIPS